MPILVGLDALVKQLRGIVLGLSQPIRGWILAKAIFLEVLRTVSPLTRENGRAFRHSRATNHYSITTSSK